MANSTDLSDVWINRGNLAQARSLRALLPLSSASTAPGVAEPEEEDDFKTMSEEGGVGTKRAYDDESTAVGYSSKRRATTDKLFEQLLGKKEAHARKKARMAEAASSGLKSTANRPTTTTKLPQSDSEDDEGGRAEAFKSRRPKKPSGAQSGSDQRMEASSDEDGGGISKGTKNPKSTIKSDDPPVPHTSRQKAPTFLDELLSKKKKKKKSKEKQDSNT